MSTVPIPEGSTIAAAPAPVSEAVPIPSDAIVEQQPGKGVTADSMNADYQFKHPALTDDEMHQLKAANLDRPLYRKLLGLPAVDPAAAALDAKDQAHQTESAQQSSYVQEQLTDKAAGGAVVAGAPVIAGAAQAAPAAAAPIIAAAGPPVARIVGTAVRLARTPVGKAALEYSLKAAGAGAGYALAKKWLGL